MKRLIDEFVIAEVSAYENNPVESKDKGVIVK